MPHPEQCGVCAAVNPARGVRWPRCWPCARPPVPPEVLPAPLILCPECSWAHPHQSERRRSPSGPASYSGLHHKVRRLRGTPSKCDQCGTTAAGRFEWASLTRNYADPGDYVRLCVKCHRARDARVAREQKAREA